MPSIKPSQPPLGERHCRRLAPGEGLLGQAELEQGLAQLAPGWESPDGKRLVKTFTFDRYCRTMAFVNAVAWIAEQEDHHPDLEVSYGRCRVTWSTHSAGGLTENDLVCAAKIEAIAR